MVWKYNNISVSSTPVFKWKSTIDAISSQGLCSTPPQCIYCKGQMKNLDSRKDESDYIRYETIDCGDVDDISDGEQIYSIESQKDQKKLLVCSNCGWWIIWKRYISEDDEDIFEDFYLGHSVLKDLDVTDVSAETGELCRYLLARYEKRKSVNPRSFEKIVASVFRSGFDVIVTSYSGDNGLDLIVLNSDTDKKIGVQVKRYKNKIEAEQIRSFAGALLYAGITKGIYVTTGQFRSGAMVTANNLKRRGYLVELLDGEQFYDRLGVAWKPDLKSLLTSPPLNKWDTFKLKQVGSAHTYSAY